FKVHPQVQSLATGGRRTSQEKASEILRRAIGPRRRSAESQLYRAVRVGRHVQVGVVEVESGFDIAEFEIHATAAHANGRDAIGTGRAALPQKLEVPRSRVGLHHIDGRVVQIQTGKLKPP